MKRQWKRNPDGSPDMRTLDDGVSAAPPADGPRQVEQLAPAAIAEPPKKPGWRARIARAFDWIWP